MKCNYIIYILMFMLLFSCNNDIQDITVQGTVKNAENNTPIIDASVTVICWKCGNSPDASYSEYETKIITTDNKGKYQVNFDKGAFVEVKVSIYGYINGHEVREIYNKKNTINLLLDSVSEVAF